jgi:hypothetical protein
VGDLDPRHARRGGAALHAAQTSSWLCRRTRTRHASSSRRSSRARFDSPRRATASALTAKSPQVQAFSAVCLTMRPQGESNPATGLGQNRATSRTWPKGSENRSRIRWPLDSPEGVYYPLVAQSHGHLTATKVERAGLDVARLSPSRLKKRNDLRAALRSAPPPDDGAWPRRARSAERCQGRSVPRGASWVPDEPTVPGAARVLQPDRPAMRRPVVRLRPRSRSAPT